MNLLHKTITVDIDDWKYLRRHNINLSAEIRDYLSQRVAIMRGELGGIDIELIRRKLEVKKEKFTELQAEIRSMEEILFKAKEKVEEQKITALEEEKKKIEASTKCINCSNIISHKAHQFNNGKVCHACYMTTTGDQIKKWNEK